MNENEIKNIIEQFSTDSYNKLKPNFIRENIDEIKNIDGRKQSSPRACRSSSSVYILYSKSDSILYIGETGTSVKRRCFGDGSGSHCKKEWFTDVSYIVHLTYDNE